MLTAGDRSMLKESTKGRGMMYGPGDEGSQPSFVLVVFCFVFLIVLHCPSILTLLLSCVFDGVAAGLLFDVGSFCGLFVGERTSQPSLSVFSCFFHMSFSHFVYLTPSFFFVLSGQF